MWRECVLIMFILLYDQKKKKKKKRKEKKFKKKKKKNDYNQSCVNMLNFTEQDDILHYPKSLCLRVSGRG